ncbi:hypothetical protein K488DRAFT_91944 [Vararia minispora EC-137]|uniref:Uncharacterized protein n=1 Tax=Vararia minispora EC-137 TaxID=1314806 RepID=A0ACB8Q500_9AGAM|nr:hypothetical protein K488DRAFT_91944 [Vararia minispora EC-137]
MFADETRLAYKPETHKFVVTPVLLDSANYIVSLLEVERNTSTIITRNSFRHPQGTYERSALYSQLVSALFVPSPSAFPVAARSFICHCVLLILTLIAVFHGVLEPDYFNGRLFTSEGKVLCDETG